MSVIDEMNDAQVGDLCHRIREIVLETETPLDAIVPLGIALVECAIKMETTDGQPSTPVEVKKYLARLTGGFVDILWNEFRAQGREKEDQ